jgi:ribosomal protein L12E/L44/L45/RPP1/RPP2
MVQPFESEKLKALLKSAIVEVLEERQDLLQDAVAAALEDVGMARAIAQGEQSPHVSRADVFSSLDGGE